MPHGSDKIVLGRWLTTNGQTNEVFGFSEIVRDSEFFVGGCPRRIIATASFFPGGLSQQASFFSWRITATSELFSLVDCRDSDCA
jgi:hypothetical protein